MLIIGAISGTESKGPEHLSSNALSHEFETVDGEVSTLNSYKGEPLVINFFASTCPPCKAEMPDFESVSKTYAGRVKFLGVSHDLNRASWRSVVDETGVTYETVFQPTQEIFQDLGGRGLPTTYFISADGEIKDFHGGVLTEKTLEENIQEHLLKMTNDG